MRILIDFTQIPLQKAGVGVYGLNLVGRIYAQDKLNNYYILVQDDETCFNSLNNRNFKILKISSRFFRIRLLRIIIEQIYIPYLVLRYHIDIVHSLHYSFPLLAPARKVVTIHDMTFSKVPGKHVPVKVPYFRAFIWLAALLADRIITVSQSTLSDLAKKFPLVSGKSRVIYHGKGDNSVPGMDESAVEAVKNKYGIKGDYFLFVGTIEPRKNIHNLILGFHEYSLENNDYSLVIAGKKGWYYKEIFNLPARLGIAEKVIFTGFIDDKEKEHLMKGAKIFIYPSFYEGFGLPVLESISFGVPTITSNSSSMPEIAGSAALLIDPNRPDEIYSSISKLVSDKELYASLQKKGIEQASRFTWEKAASETIEVYSSLLNKT